MPPRHILIVNARNVTQPVFVIGAPHSGAEAVGRALKISPGFHLTIGQQPVLQAVYGFARRPSLYNGRGEAAAAVIRDAFAQGWQLNPTSCLDCTPQCRSAAGLKPSEVGPCMEQRGLSRFGDASPDLAYCAEALVHAFPDALIVQVVRDGRDTVAAMIEDPVAMSWFRPSVVNIDSEFPNPFYGVEDESDRLSWPALSNTGKCAMRWRGAIRLAARLHRSLPETQLKTLRYEDMARNPGEAAALLTDFTGSKIAAPVTPNQRRAKLEQNAWRRSFSYSQLAEVEKVAGEELRRLGYK
jgi:sulfotransferase family protein